MVSVIVVIGSSGFDVGLWVVLWYLLGLWVGRG